MGKREEFVVSINGGIQITTGKAERCAIDAIQYIRKHQTVYVRRRDDLSTVVAFVKPANPSDSPVACTTTRHGAGVSAPDWAQRFHRLFSY